jgi:hypothetical protein
MKVYVTNQQFACIQEAVLRMEDTRNTTEVVGLLAICTLSNGGDFKPGLARCGVPTEIIMIAESGT